MARSNTAGGEGTQSGQSSGAFSAIKVKCRNLIKWKQSWLKLSKSSGALSDSTIISRSTICRWCLIDKLRFLGSNLSNWFSAPSSSKFLNLQIDIRFGGMIAKSWVKPWAWCNPSQVCSFVSPWKALLRPFMQKGVLLFDDVHWLGFSRSHFAECAACEQPCYFSHWEWPGRSKCATWGLNLAYAKSCMFGG